MVKFISYKFLPDIFLLSLLICFHSLCYSQTGWIQQFSGTGDSLRSVKFMNPQSGWVVGSNGIVLKTSNAGINWIQSDASITNDLNSVYLISESYLFAAGETGAVIRTTNAGLNWDYLNSETNANLNSVCFINSQTGWASGTSGVIIKTTNSGLNWTVLNSGTNIDLKSIQFANTQKGWAAGYGGIFHSSNGGANWFPQFIDGNLNLNSIYFTDSANGWTAYYDHDIFGPEAIKTVDGGTAWINHPMDNSYSLSVFFINSVTGWSSGFFGSIKHSSDGGVTWITQPGGTGENLNSIYFVDPLNGWSAGNSGVILRTTTGGVLTNYTNSGTQIPDRTFLLQNYPNPFNPYSHLEFGISDLGFVKLRVYDVAGINIVTLVNEIKPAGIYNVVFDGSELSSGIYFYTLSLDGVQVDSKRMVLLK